MEMEPTFKHIIRQEPNRGRICGLKHVVNRRLIDPPLVIELQPLHRNRFTENIICHVTLFSADHCDNLSTLVKQDGEILETLVGDNVVPCDKFVDPVDETTKLFIIVPNISIRIVGKFTLQYHLIDLQSGYMTSGFTRPFQIYSNKVFPGNLGVTKLTRSFIKQGIRIRTKEATAQDSPQESS
ncbi:velvet factor [Globomyces pollinis-pini]|nr:velvet factor [Globomyces pollinis-pini]